MNYSVVPESFDSITTCWKSKSHPLRWSSVFVLPGWMETWWREFQPRAELYLCSIRDDKGIIGIAPLQLLDKKAFFIGSTDDCDYMDFIVAPGRENDFFNALLDNLIDKGINQLELADVRPDSTVLTHLVPVAESRGYGVSNQENAVSVEMDLPADFDEYLASLDKKQRHEVKRKLRRLGEADKVDYRCVNHEPLGLLDNFLKLFPLSREEKAMFLNPRMESFFRSIARAMAEIGLLRFGVLEVGGTPSAMIMGFDYQGTIYLYNSAYNPDYSYLSAGVLSKILGIKESIRSGAKKWDFLKGAEAYKYHLGGKEISLQRCQITIK